MRLRPRTIRTQLVALLLVPLVSLAALWTYSTYTSVRPAVDLIRISETYDYYGAPTDELTRSLQQERRAAAVYVASGGRAGEGDLDVTEHTSDDLLAVLRAHADQQAEGAGLVGSQEDRLSDVLTATNDLNALREDVRARTFSWSFVADRYSAVISSAFRLRAALSALTTGVVARQATVAIELVRARELLSQEDAMVSAALVSETPMSSVQYQEFTSAIDGRTLLHAIYEPELPSGPRDRLVNFENGHLGVALRAAETSAADAGGGPMSRVLSDKEWRAAADDALGELLAINIEAKTAIGVQARDTGMAVVVRAGVVSLVGLIAVVLTIIVSARIGRRITRRLTALRDEALELSGSRLPEVMRRLRAGEDVDTVEADAAATSVLRLGDDEIGQVGRAFMTAQKAAVRATAEQERMRRGVAAVFTTLARRSQVLLHRQLTLLDSMERNTQDPAELENLFRLDHMTNRMRRHAEGLLILSGNAPGRAWRRPVRLAEVVRAAVGEVEEYPRVVVRRMPRMALAGPSVADVLHLLAELIENATVFSPPGSKVVIRGELVASGFAIEIEDRGLGMSPERLLDANRELGLSAAGLELPETDRLGLFTVGRLAGRQGVRVTLRRGRQGGSAAVVFLPKDVLDADPADDTETGEYVLRPRAVPSARPPAGRAPERAPEAEPGPSPVGGPQERTGTGLPKRVRQASLVAQLRDDPVHESPAQAPPAGALPERSPEQARSTMAAYAEGMARARVAGTDRPQELQELQEPQAVQMRSRVTGEDGG